MKHQKLHSIYFLISVAVLLLNDLYLKYEFHNYFTGKLSDFAGLFAFPYFFAVFFPRQAKAVYIATAVLFTIWKSELIQPLLDLAHATGFGFNRIVDYSDLMALAILPLSYRYFTTPVKANICLGYIGKPVIIAVCSFAFIATSLPQEVKEVNLKSGYTVHVATTRESLLEKQVIYAYENDNYILPVYPEEKENVRVTTHVIIEESSGNVRIRLDSIYSYSVTGTLFRGVDSDDVDAMENVTLQDYERYFRLELERKFGKAAVKVSD